MSVAITAQAPVAASASATVSPQAAPGPNDTNEQGLVDFFAQTRVDVANGHVTEATNSMASSGEMLGKLREFIERAHKSDADIQATRAKRRGAAAEADLDLASLDTLGSLGKSNSLAQFNPIGHSGSFGQLASHNGYGHAGLPPGPASASLDRNLGLEIKDRPFAMLDKITNDSMDAAIHNMWVQVVGHASKSITDSVMTLVKGQ